MSTGGCQAGLGKHTIDLGVEDGVGVLFVVVAGVAERAGSDANTGRLLVGDALVDVGAEDI